MEPIQSVIVGEAVAGESAKLRKQAEKLIGSLEKNQLDIAELLWKIKKEGHPNNWGFATYAEWVKTTGLKDSKARYLPQIAEVMEKVGMTRDKYEPLGIAKLRAIVALNPDKTWTNPGNGEELPLKDFIVGITAKAIEQPDEYKLEDIKKDVRTLKGIVGDNDYTFMGLKLKRSVREKLVNPLFEMYRAKIGEVGKDDEGNAIYASDAYVFECICAEAMSGASVNVQNFIMEEDVDGEHVVDEHQ